MVAQVLSFFIHLCLQCLNNELYIQLLELM